MTRKTALQLIEAERVRQDQLRKAGRFPYTLNNVDVANSRKLTILMEEIGEVSRACAEELHIVDADEVPPDAHVKLEAIEKNLKEELVQCAALCLSWLESL